MEAYRQNRFRAAIEHFKEADRLAPSARLSFNIALAYERMSDGPNALAAYRDYLRRSPKAENATTTSVRISELELQLQKSGVQQVTIQSTPPGALVLLDDVSRGVTPWTGEIAAGAHRLNLRVRGYEDSTHTFDMSARHSMDLTYELRPAVSPPPGAVATASSAGSALAASSAAAPYETLPEVEQPSAGVRWWTWTGLGTSAALLVGSGVLELSRRGLEDDAGDRRSAQPQAERKWHEMNDRKTAARVVLGVGAAVGVLSGVSLYLDLDRSRSESTDIGLACEGGDCQLQARGTW
jgi:tetratricopeptide (TPR) repeat protein